MYVPDFVIPLNRGELLNACGQYSLKEECSVEELRERLEAAREALNEGGSDFIVDHFSTYFWLLQKFKQCPQLVREKGWKTIRKAFSLLCRNLQVLFEDSTNLDSELQSKMCNITKMTVYVLIEFMKVKQDLHTEQVSSSLEGKIKRKQMKLPSEEGDWKEEKHTVLIEIHSFLQFPLKMLWEPPVVEEEFINLIANFCYTCLEDPTIGSATTKHLRETIFQVLGILIKKYLHGLSFCVKIVQLLRMNDHLVNPLVQGIVHLVKECSCTNIVKEIVREVADTDGDQLAADSAGTRNLNLFIVQLAECIPETIMPAMDLLVSHLSGDSYSMRICVVGVLGEIVLTVLTKADLEESVKRMRDEYLDSLEEHIHDVNAFVRAKVLQIFQKLCVSKAIPISRMNRLLELVIGRLYDKSTNVKKQAVHLIKDLLEGNPFCGQLNISEIKSQLLQERHKLDALKIEHNITEGDDEWLQIEPKLKELLENNPNDADLPLDDTSTEELVCAIGRHLVEGRLTKAVATITRLESEFYSAHGLQKDNLSCNALLELLSKIFRQAKPPPLMDASPEVHDAVEKQRKTIEYLESALEFSQLIDKALPVILTFLDSNAVTDALEAIHFFTAAYLFGFGGALEGVRKMLYLVFSKEANVKAAVSGAYKELYFQAQGTERQQSLATVKNLSELVLKLNFSQLDALQEVVKEWVREGIIDKNCVQVMFERFSMRLPGTEKKHCWAALVLIRMVGAAEAKIIKSNLSVLVSEGLRNLGAGNFLIAKETCTALHHLLPAKDQGKPLDHTLRYPADHDLFRTLHHLLTSAIWTTQDPYFIPMAEEAINLVFHICDRPDEFCRNLIHDLHGGISRRKRPEEGSGHALEKGEKLHLGEEEEEAEAEERKEEENSDELFITLLTRFISILGQVAGNYILYLEGPVLDELKRRNQLEYERKLRKLEENKKFNVSMKKSKRVSGESAAENLNESATEDLEFNRVAADDMDAEEMRRRTEKEVVTGKGLLASYAPLIVAVCKNPGKYSNRPLQNAALLALTKFMAVSSVFCEENLQLVMTICEKSQLGERQENAMIALGALQYRFPNSLEPWTPHMYAMLASGNPSVRYSAILVLTDLIVNEMIKVRSHISSLALCIVDKELKIARVARHFFREFSLKGNSLYNVLPTLISNLTQANAPLAPNDFKFVIKYVLSLLTKDKQNECLVDKLCQYFDSATTDRQCCDLAYCLSLLTYSDRALKKLLDNLRTFAAKLYLPDVYEALCAIASEAAKNPHKDRALVSELNAVIKEFKDKSCEEKSVCGARRRPCPVSGRKRAARRRYLESESESEEEEEKEAEWERERERERGRKERAGQLKRRSSVGEEGCRMRVRRGGGSEADG